MPYSQPAQHRTEKDHTKMSLQDAVNWTRANSHLDTRKRLRSRSVAYILLEELIATQEAYLEILGELADLRSKVECHEQS